MKYLRSVLIAIFCFSITVNAQETTRATGLGVDINSSLKLGALYSLKPSLRTRFTNVIDRINSSELFDESGKARLDLQLIGERTIRESTKGAIGVLYRFGEIQNAVRIFQQIAWVQNINTRINFIHRIKTDQTFRAKNEFRYRYRFGLMAPLKGFRLNKNEKYLLSSIEYLAQVSLGNYSTEMRLKMSIGQLYKNGNKGELGLDLRYDNSVVGINEFLYLLNFSYFFSLSN